MQTPPQSRFQKATRYFVIVAALLVLIGWLVATPSGLFGKVDAIGYAVCHQIPERSFPLGEGTTPLCARCSGMYISAMVGLLFQAVIGWKRSNMPHWSVLIFLGLFVVAFGVDGANSYLYLMKSTYVGAFESIPNLYIPNNTLRILTGSGMGLGMALALFPAFNSTVWADADSRRALPNLKSFALLVGITLAANLLVLTEHPLVLYPLAFVSVGGVLLLLTMVYTMVWAMLMRQENAFTRLSQMWLPLLAGFTIALLQVALIDALRFWMTGTWESFPFVPRT
ncbi:MAG: DUF2085 domain-containing protein [Anaerolineales bacterium]|nr:DUF2085 domain-containing protein [Anaerolineales bacterium]